MFAKKTSLACAWFLPCNIRGLWQCIRAIPCCGTLSKMHSSQWCLDNILTLQGINISHLGKRKIIFKMPFLGDMWVLGFFWVVATQTCFIVHPEIWGRWTQFDEHIFQRGWNHQPVFEVLKNEQKSESRSWTVRTLDNHLMKHGGVKHGGFPKPFDTRNYQGFDSKATTLLVEIDPIGRAASSQPGCWKTTNLKKQKEYHIQGIYKVVNILMK